MSKLSDLVENHETFLGIGHIAAGSLTASIYKHIHDEKRSSPSLGLISSSSMPKAIGGASASPTSDIAYESEPSGVNTNTVVQRKQKRIEVEESPLGVTETRLLASQIVTLKTQTNNSESNPHIFEIDLISAPPDMLTNRRRLETLIHDVQTRTYKVYNTGDISSKTRYEGHYFKDVYLVPRKSNGIEVSSVFHKELDVLINEETHERGRWRYPYYQSTIMKNESQSRSGYYYYEVGKPYRFGSR